MGYYPTKAECSSNESSLLKAFLAHSPISHDDGFTFIPYKQIYIHPSTSGIARKVELEIHYILYTSLPGFRETDGRMMMMPKLKDITAG